MRGKTVAVMAGVAMMLAAPSPAAASTVENAPVVVDSFALVERAPVRNGFAPFSIEAAALLPAPRKRDSFVPTEDEHFHPLRRTVDRFLRRKEIVRGWSRSNEATLTFGDEVSRFSGADGIAYAIEGEMVVRGNGPVPLGLKLTAPPGPAVRYAVGLIVAEQVVLVREGMLEGANRSVDWMVSLRPNGPDAALPVRAVFAARIEGAEGEGLRRALSSVKAAVIASSDGRVAVAERPRDASEWLKPLQVFLRPDQVGAAPEGDKAAKDKPEKKSGGGGH